MTESPFVVVSGMPASGKTALARALAEMLELPLLDKDDILESLYDGFDQIDVALRQHLSRQSDEEFRRAAQTSGGAVLVSFWRPLGAEGASGTPSDWLRELGEVVEVYCDCPPAVAEARFRNRRRHPGHNDDARSQTLAALFAQLSANGPLGVGAPVRVDTHAGYDLAAVATEVRRRLMLRRGE